MTIRAEGQSSDGLVESTATTAGATVAGLFQSTRLTQVDGRVGIGTTAPSVAFDVAGAARLRVLAPGDGTDYFVTADADGNLRRRVASALADDLGDHEARENIHLNDFWISNDGSNVGLRVANNGDVGIGSAVPTERLDVDGAGLFRNGNNGNGFAKAQLYFGWNGSATYRHAIRTRHNSSGDAGNAFDFYVWDEGTDAIDGTPSKRVLTISGEGSSGRVGIGTDAPGVPLDVDGDATVRAALRVGPDASALPIGVVRVGQNITSGGTSVQILNQHTATGNVTAGRSTSFGSYVFMRNDKTEAGGDSYGVAAHPRSIRGPARSTLTTTAPTRER